MAEPQRRRKVDLRFARPEAEETLQSLLEVARSTGSKLCELGEHLKRLQSANESGRAEQAILSLDAQEYSEALNYPDLMALVRSILEAREQSRAALPMRGARAGGKAG
jgi:hypothetical protein